MMYDRLAKMLFPRSQRYERRTRLNTIILALIVGLAVAGFVAVAMIMKNAAGR
jgi:hypothetical protein